MLNLRVKTGKNKNLLKKRNLLIGSFILVVLAAAALTTVILLHKPVPLVSIQGLDDQQASKVTSFLASEQNGFGEPLQLADRDTPGPDREPDIVFQPKDHRLTKNPEAFSALDPGSVTSMPRSILKIGVINNQLITLPVALDHVELLFRRDLFAANGLPVKDRILGLEDLESVLAELRGPRFFPLVVAGGEETELLDFLSVLVLSLGGVDQYQALVRIAETPEPPEELLSADLGGGWRLSNAVSLLREWKDQRILHPDWASFTPDDVLEFAQRQLTGAVVMRLSTHRTWPLHVLRRWQSSPFPFEDPTDAGSGLITPALVAAVPTDAARSEEAAAILPGLVSRPFQDEAVQSWRLAPVHSTAEALDRESGDVRFWAAASRELLPPLSDALSPEAAAELIAQLRSAL